MTMMTFEEGWQHRLLLNIKVEESGRRPGQGHCPTPPDLPLSDDVHVDVDDDDDDDDDVLGRQHSKGHSAQLPLTFRYPMMGIILILINVCQLNS